MYFNMEFQIWNRSILATIRRHSTKCTQLLNLHKYFRLIDLQHWKLQTPWILCYAHPANILWQPYSIPSDCNPYQNSLRKTWPNRSQIYPVVLRGKTTLHDSNGNKGLTKIPHLNFVTTLSQKLMIVMR